VPSTSRPTGPPSAETKAATLVVWVLRTRAAAWISSVNATSTPRPRAAGSAATVSAASRFAGPSAPACWG
jgi:hypothetical protein